MEKLRESIIHGTADFPFARYRISRSKVGGNMCSVHWHPEQEILFVREGTAELLCNKRSIFISKGDIAFIPPGEVHYVQSASPFCVYTAFVFSLSLISLPEQHFFQKMYVQPLESGALCFPPVISTTDPAHDAIAQVLTPLVDCDLTLDSCKLAAFRAVLDICGVLSPHMMRREANYAKGNHTVKACLRYMESNYDKKLSLQEIAEQVHLHPNYLCALFRDYTGQTVFQQLIRIRVENAAKLLRTQDISVTQAGILCGFDSSGFFTKKFKALMGLTPTDYKKRYP